jgi:hypothetical protein
MIAFAFLALVVAIVAAWLIVTYAQAGVEAAENGIDPDQPANNDAGHV